MKGKKIKKRFPWLQCILSGFLLATFISFRLAFFRSLSANHNVDLVKIIGDINILACAIETVLFTLIAAVFIIGWRLITRLIMRSDFIDYHPTDNVKKDKDQTPPHE